MGPRRFYSEVERLVPKSLAWERREVFFFSASHNGLGTSRST